MAIAPPRVITLKYGNFDGKQLGLYEGDAPRAANKIRVRIWRRNSKQWTKIRVVPRSEVKAWHADAFRIKDVAEALLAAVKETK